MCTDTHKCKKTGNREKAQRKQKRLIQLVTQTDPTLSSFGVPLADTVIAFLYLF